jgi:hypothetical protein
MEITATRRALVLLNVLPQIIGKYKVRARVYRETIEKCRPQQ